MGIHTSYAQLKSTNVNRQVSHFRLKKKWAVPFVTAHL